MKIYGKYQTLKGLPKNGTDVPKAVSLDMEWDALTEPLSRQLRAFCPEDLKEDGEVPSGLRLPIDWDSASYVYDPESGTGGFICKGLMLAGKDADDVPDLFRAGRITHLWFEVPEWEPDKKIPVHLEELLFRDGTEEWKANGIQSVTVNVVYGMKRRRK